MKIDQLNIIIKTTFAAVHHWPTIPEDCTEQYLKYPHRHLFHVTLKVPVTHTNRDVEFIELKNQLDDHIRTLYPRYGTSDTLNVGTNSCEDIAINLVDAFEAVYCSVMEDDENGAEFIKGQR